MLRFRWWSHNLHRTRHMSRKVTGALWEPTGVLPQAKDDVSPARALPAPEQESPKSPTGDTTFVTHQATPAPAHVASAPPLLSQVHTPGLPVSPVVPPVRGTRTDVLPPLDIPRTPDMAPVSWRSALLPTAHSPSKSGEDGKYLLQAPYLIPLDAAEANRLDFQHYALRQSLSGNYAAPVESPHTILDVGTGTGRWGIELATFFPQASVIGTDIMTPLLTQRPHNFVFVRNNVLEGLPFASNSFDFVHQRLLLSSIPMSKLRFLVAELLRVTAAKGWIELVESDVTVQQGGPANRKMVQWAVEASRLHGIEPHLNVRIGEFLRLMHLKSVEVRSIALPLGHWGGRIGRLMAADMVGLSQAMKPPIVAQKGLSNEEYDHTCWQMQQEWEMLHSTLIFHIAYGQYVGA